MNVAFQALLIFLLYFPGALCVTGYLGKISQKQEMPYFSGSLSNRAGIAFVAAMLLHALWIGGGIFGHTLFKTSWRPDPQLVLNLLISNGSESLDESPSDELDLHSGRKVQSVDTSQRVQEKKRVTAIRELSDNLYPMFVYFLSLYICSWFIGAGLHRIVRDLVLDRHWKILRYPNHWHYALSGEAIQFNGSSTEVPVVAMQALVELEGRSYIYCGLVHRWHHNPADGLLDWVQLEFPSRVVLKDGCRIKLEHLPAGLLYLKFSEIKNFLLRYYRVEFAPAGVPSHDLENRDGTHPDDFYYS